jgi:uncharacterized protein with PIN domain
MRRVPCRVYGELNDFLPVERRGRTFMLEAPAHSSLKDTIEAVGVPHPELDLIVINGRAVDLNGSLQDGDRLAVYPRFRSIDLQGLPRLGRRLPRPARFVADVHLGKLAARLRLAGFDVASAADDRTLASMAAGDARILLTRDRELLKRRDVLTGRWVRQTDPDAQFVEVIQYFDLLGDMQPFTRCLRCGSALEPVSKADVFESLPARTRTFFDEFQRCPACHRVYWRGSHFKRLRDRLGALVERAGALRIVS